jgi:hypothetical protein
MVPVGWLLKSTHAFCGPMIAPDPDIDTITGICACAVDDAPTPAIVAAASASSDLRTLDLNTLPPNPLFRGATLRGKGRARKGLQTPTFV